MRPGVNVAIVDQAPPRSQPTDVDVWFLPGVTNQGDLNPHLIRSLTDYETVYGPRQSWTPIYDYLDAYFREGGAKAYVVRVVGPAAVVAHVTMGDLDVRGKGPGTYYNGLSAEIVTTTGTFVLKIWQGTTLLEQTPSLASKTEAVNWSKTSKYVNVVDTDLPDTTVPPTTAKAALTGGLDDRAAITNTSYTAALDKFSTGLGPGQVSVPGNIDAAVASALLKHAYDHNRVALLDAPDSATASVLISAAGTLQSDVNARYGGMFGPTAIIPGLVANSTRVVPYSAIQAGITARMQNPNEPAAGENGQARYAVAVTYDYSDSERQNLNSAGVNIARNMFGGVRTYGYRTLADEDLLPQWLQFNALRTVMSVKAQADVIGETFVFKQIDGRGIEIGKFNGALTGMLIPFYDEGALYGETPAEAFYVDTGPSINTPETIADGELKAVVFLRTSPFAEMVQIDIVKVRLPSTTDPTRLITAAA